MGELQKVHDFGDECADWNKACLQKYLKPRDTCFRLCQRNQKGGGGQQVSRNSIER